MPENENKIVSQMRQEEMDKGKLKRVNPVDTSNLKTDDLTKSALNHQQTQNKVNATDEAIGNAYYSPMQQLGVWASERQEAKNKLKEQDETAQRQASNLKMIAGISDGLASLANLIGVADRGTNIQMTSALTPLEQKMEAARLERKADIKSIDDRLEQYKNQMLQMQLAKGSAVAAAKAKEAEMAERKAAELRGYAHSTNLAKMQIEAAAKGRKEGYAFEAEQNKKKIEAQKEIANANNAADVMKYTIRYGQSKDKNIIPFVIDDPSTGKMRTINLSDKSLTNILAAYLPKAIKNGEITEEQAEDAKNWRSNEVSKTNLLGLVNSSETMREALLTAVGDSENATDAEDKGNTSTSFTLWGQQTQPAPKGWMVNDDGTEKYNKK